MGAFDRLIDDASMLSPGAVTTKEAVAAHRDHRESPYAELVGPLVVPDDRLTHVGRACGTDPLDVSVVISGGAGGLLAASGREVAGVAVVSVESALRDLDDLAGNVARVAAAAADLGDDVSVFVELPYVHGWIGAVEEVEAAGLLGAIRVGGTQPDDRLEAERLAQQLSVLVEADLPFKTTGGLRRAWPSAAGHGYLTILIALEALVDGAEVADAAELLRLDDHERIKAAVQSWDDATGSRVRRRLRSFSSLSVPQATGDLHALGLF